jgi:hypothetical protein
LIFPDESTPVEAVTMAAWAVSTVPRVSTSTNRPLQAIRVTGLENWIGDQLRERTEEVSPGGVSEWHNARHQGARPRPGLGSTRPRSSDVRLFPRHLRSARSNRVQWSINRTARAQSIVAVDLPSKAKSLNHSYSGSSYSPPQRNAAIPSPTALIPSLCGARGGRRSPST